MKLSVYLSFLSLVALLFGFLFSDLNIHSVSNHDSGYSEIPERPSNENITIAGVNASIGEHLDKINLLNYQYPQQAQVALNTIEQAAIYDSLSDAEQLRFALLRCYNLLEQGEYQAVINSAKLGEAKAKQLKLDHASAYFILCQADALNYFGQVDQALPLIDSALEIAQKHRQPQAIVSALFLRAIIDTQMENYNSTMEDLSRALDMYPQALTQSPAWQLTPKAYVLAAMGSLFMSTGDISQARFYTDKARTEKRVAGKMEYILFINSAVLTLGTQEEHLADSYLAHSKKLLSELTHPIDLAQGYSLFANVDLARNRLDLAEEQISTGISIFSMYQHPIFLARAKRILAQIRFRQGRDEEALVIMAQSIKLAKDENQDADLQEYYAILSQYFADNQAFKQAYEYQVLRFELEKKINAKINQARFLQFKARASEQHQLTDSAIPSLKKPSQQYLSLRQTYGLVALGLVLLFISIIFFIKKEPKLAPLSRKLDEQEQEVSGILKNAKRAGYPLSILLLNISHIRQVDLGDLQTLLTHTLREQDILKRHTLDEIIIFLPRASLEGARRVASQVKGSLENWQAGCKVEIGVASLQQLDSFEQLVKKAQQDQISKAPR